MLINNTEISNEKLLNILHEIASTAGDEAMFYYDKDPGIKIKPDNSQVTKADLLADEIIREMLGEFLPDVKIITEETADENTSPDGHEFFFLVDPIDGTYHFINRTGDFGVYIGLVHKDTPIAGVIYHPISKTSWVGVVNGGAFKILPSGEKLLLSGNVKTDNLNMYTTRHYKEELHKKHIVPYKMTLVDNPKPLKWTLLFEGELDGFSHFGRNFSWDTAAPHAILNSLNGGIFDVNMKELSYRVPGFKNPEFIGLANRNILIKGE